MTAFRIKLCGLDDGDSHSLKSMLKLADKLLTHNWEVVTEGEAELTIYSFETENGKLAWQQHESGISALLTMHGNISEPIDIILKKPLRTTNFADALNIVEDKVQQPQHIEAHNSTTLPSEEVTAPQKKPSIWSSITTNLAKRFTSQKAPSKDLPELTLDIPTFSSSSADTITDTKTLIKWIEELSQSDSLQITSTLLRNLISLNKLSIPNNLRLKLLEEYRKPINKALFTRDLNTLRRERNNASGNAKAYRTLNLLIEEIAAGYQIIVSDYYHQGNKPSSSNDYLFSINRLAEQLSHRVLSAYQAYQAVPVGVLHYLHQLYHYVDIDNVSEKRVSISDNSDSQSFSYIYSQLLLISITDPYSLGDFDVFRLFAFMAKMAEHVEIGHINENQINITKDILLSGHFCIDITQDHIPTAMAKTSVNIRSLPTTRLFNTQSVLLNIEIIAKKALHDNYDLETPLLRKVAPQLNASYERKYQRLPSVKHRHINLADGLDNIHRCIKSGDLQSTEQWILRNQGSGGIMISRDLESKEELRIGDFMGIFEETLPMNLALIKWLYKDHKGITYIGLESHSGQAEAITFTLNDDETNYKALLLPEAKDVEQATTLVTEKGAFTPNREITLHQSDDETQLIQCRDLLNSNINYQQFSFINKARS